MSQEDVINVESTIVCIVDKVVFHNKGNGYSVLSVLSRVKKGPFCICGILNGKPKDTVLVCRGIWNDHPKYGQTFIVKSWEDPSESKNSCQKEIIVEEIEVACLVEKLLFHKKETNYSVLLVTTPEEKAPFRIFGQLEQLDKNTLLQCKGEWSEHDVFGPQFKVKSWQRLGNYYEFKNRQSNDEEISGQTYSYILSVAFGRVDNLISWYHESVFEISKGYEKIRKELYQIAKDCVNENVNPRSINLMMKLYILVDNEVTNYFWDEVYKKRRS